MFQRLLDASNGNSEGGEPLISRTTYVLYQFRVKPSQSKDLGLAPADNIQFSSSKVRGVIVGIRLRCVDANPQQFACFAVGVALQ